MVLPSPHHAPWPRVLMPHNHRVCRCHCSVHNKTLLVANYMGGTICALPINDDGSLGPAGCVVETGTGTATHVSGRQATAHPHMITPSPDGRFVFVADLGTNSVIGYTLTIHARVACSRTLTKHSEFSLHENAGPRHMAFSPTAPFAYVLNELDNTVVPLRYDAEAGTFSALESLADGGRVSALAEGTPRAGGGGAAEIVVSADGRFAYASVRFAGKDNMPPVVDGAEPDRSGWASFNSIAILALNAETGAVKFVGSVPSGGNIPWTHQLIDSDSKLVVQNQHTKPSPKPEDDGACGEGPGKVVVFSRDKETGALTPTEVTADVPANVSVCVVELA
jgi:6-phosphogluconolactonase